jgi:acetoin utilization deacetylase AcuC-like enzyme
MTKAHLFAGAASVFVPLAAWFGVWLVCASRGADQAPAAPPATVPYAIGGDAHGRSAAMTVGLVWDERYLAHEAPGHTESPKRLEAIRQALEAAHLWDRLTHLPPRPAEEEDVLRVHSDRHLHRLRHAPHEGCLTWFDGDTYACKESFQAALLAAGGVCAAADAVMKGDVRSAFCAVRPPGHHASRDRAMGFCLLNNVAIGVRHVQVRHGLHHVLILDWDVHHGNGTQDTFYRDADVMYISIHQSPLYPGTGSARETGEGPGAGHVRNYPLAPGSGPKEFLAALDEGLKLAADFRPEFIFISSGFDAHRDDPLGGLALTEETYAEATRRVRRLADRTASGRIVSVLEGGYNLDALGRSVAAHVSALLAP